MKLKVIGWTYSDNFTFDEGEGSFAAHAAIVEDMRAHGYDFSGWHHQEAENGAPVLNDGMIYRYSQRGWGSLMADVFEDHDSLYSYSRYAFSHGYDDEDVKMPPRERSIERLIHDAANELLTEEERDYLFEGDYTARFPHPELGDKEIYTLTPEEAEDSSVFETVRQLPNCIMRRIVCEDLAEAFELDGLMCELKDDRITLEMNPALTFIGRGDTVTLGGRSYTVKNVDQYKNVTEETRIRAMYSTSEGHAEALEEFNKAEILIDIFI